MSAAVGAGEILREDFHRPGGPRGAVDKAEADTEAEKLIRARLLAAFPDWRFVGEETGRVGDDVSKPRVPDGLRHAERHGMGRLARVPRRPRLRRRPGLPRPCLPRDGLVVGSRGPLHG